jgi:hypothetical protein
MEAHPAGDQSLSAHVDLGCGITADQDHRETWLAGELGCRRLDAPLVQLAREGPTVEELGHVHSPPEELPPELLLGAAAAGAGADVAGFAAALLSVLGAVPTEVLAESEPLSPPPDLRP